MTKRTANKPSSAPIFYTRSVRDGSLAAAIGVALTLALEARPVQMRAPDAPIEAPWTGSSRIHMNFRRSGFQTQDSWGKLSGWKAAHGKWRTLR